MSKQNNKSTIVSTTPGGGIVSRGNILRLAFTLPADQTLVAWLDKNAQPVCDEKHNVTGEEG